MCFEFHVIIAEITIQNNPVHVFILKKANYQFDILLYFII